MAGPDSRRQQPSTRWRVERCCQPRSLWSDATVLADLATTIIYCIFYFAFATLLRWIKINIKHRVLQLWPEWLRPSFGCIRSKQTYILQTTVQTDANWKSFFYFLTIIVMVERNKKAYRRLFDKAWFRRNILWQRRPRFIRKNYLSCRITADQWRKFLFSFSSHNWLSICNRCDTLRWRDDCDTIRRVWDDELRCYFS